MLGTSQTLNKGRYQVLNSFSQDASGAMYEAVDTVSNVPVILRESVGRFGKVATASQIDALNAAFAGEARVLAEIDHEALVSVRDYFSEIDRQYLVLEPLNGRDLTTYLKDGVERPSIDSVLAWADQLLSGLEYLHKHAPPIIHGQIKPENLKLTSNSRIKLLTTKVSTANTLGGRPSGSGGDDASTVYMPLEQLWPELGEVSQRVILNSYDERSADELLSPLDARSDLYSAAASLYHVLTSRAPCDALERSIAILDGKSDPLVKPSEIVAGMPEELSDALLRALAMKRDNRFGSAAEMRSAFQSATQKAKERKASQTDVVENCFEPPALIVKTADDRERELEAEEARLEEEQKRIEQRKLELDAERARHAAERERLRVEAEKEQQRLAREAAEREAEEERRRVAQRLADLEAARERERAEEERLEKEAEQERLRAEERVQSLKLEQERHRAEQRRIELEARTELERAEQKIKTLSGTEMPFATEDNGDLETAFSVPAVETAAERHSPYDEAAVPQFHEQPGFNWRMPVIVGAVALIVAGAVGVWQFLPANAPAPPSRQAEVRSAPIEEAPAAVPVPEQAAEQPVSVAPLAADNETQPAGETIAAEGQPTQERQRRTQSAAALQSKKPAAEKPAPAKKKVTVDDLINDNQ
jgi:serine/threonine protein kinase